MPTLGPELPTHLNSKKRSRDSERSPDSWSHKRQARSSSPASIGPSLPTTHHANLSHQYHIGCKTIYLNSSTEACSPPEQVTLSKSDEESNGLPTKECGAPIRNIVQFSSDGEESSLEAFQNLPKETKIIKRRIFGPSPPASCAREEIPSYNDKKLHSGSNSEESSSSDDEYRPTLPPTYDCDSLEAHDLVENTPKHNSNISSTATKLKRADWMLTPPSTSDWTSRIDPTKLKNRKFAGSKGAADKSSTSALWTETFEQKRQRLENEVLGRREISTLSSSTPNVTQIPRRNLQDQETERRIKLYNQRMRKNTLYEERQAAQRRGELELKDGDDPSKRSFDREKDMALGKQIGASQTKKLLSQATNFESRFHKGSYL